MVKKIVDKGDETINTLSLRKQQVVENWRITRGHITDTCRASSISRQAYYEWLAQDPQFAQSIEDAKSELNDDLRNALIEKAASGELGAITYYLDKQHPDFKKQHVQLNQQYNYFEKAQEKADQFITEVSDD